MLRIDTSGYKVVVNVRSAVGEVDPSQTQKPDPGVNLIYNTARKLVKVTFDYAVGVDLPRGEMYVRSETY